MQGNAWTAWRVRPPGISWDACLWGLSRFPGSVLVTGITHSTGIGYATCIAWGACRPRSPGFTGVMGRVDNACGIGQTGTACIAWDT